MTQATGSGYRSANFRSPTGLHQSTDTTPLDDVEIIGRAREILRAGSALPFEDFRELNQAFQVISPSQFAILARDPNHQAGLRRYEALSWRQGSPAVMVLILLSLFALFAIMLLALGR